MSLFVKDPTSVKKLAITLKAEQKRHSELPIGDQFLNPVVKAVLLFNSGDLPTKVTIKPNICVLVPVWFCPLYQK